MARPRSVPDTEVLAAVRALIAAGGERAVSFSTAGQAAGLAPSSLVQRYGNRAGMVAAALADGWTVLTAQTDAAAAEAPRNAKGLPDLFKLVQRGEDGLIALLVPRQRDPALRDLAEAWRARMEAEIALRMAPVEGRKPAKTREAAAMAFAAWLGRFLWDAAGPGGATGFKLKTIARQLG